MFTHFASALIGLLVVVIVSMVGYWAHNITLVSTSTVIEVADLKRTDEKISQGLAAINTQLLELRAQVGQLGEFSPKRRNE